MLTSTSDATESLLKNAVKGVSFQANHIIL